MPSFEAFVENYPENYPESRRELAAVLNTITEDGIKYQLSKLKKQGKIKRIGPDKGGYWEIRDKDV